MMDDYPVAIENIKKEFERIFESDLVKEIIEIGHIRKIQAGTSDDGDWSKDKVTANSCIRNRSYL